MKNLTAACILIATLTSCVSVPTPSGRPELQVRVSTHQAKSRIASALASDGWMITASDDLGVSAYKPIDSGASILTGPGSFQIRFTLTQVSETATQIRGMMMMQTATPMDASTGKQGVDMQQFLENVFRSEMIDGPYLH